MTSRLTASSRLTIGLLAFVGVLSAHWLAYFVSAPARLAREHLLTSTGHGDWSLAGALAVGALTAAVASAVWERVRGSRLQPSVGAVAWRLAVLQTVSFLVLEAAERAVAGGNAIDAVTEPVVALGVVVQVLVALAGALVTRLLVEVIDRFVPGERPRRAPRRAGLAAGRLDECRRARLDCGARTLRGPPSSTPLST